MRAFRTLAVAITLSLWSTAHAGTYSEDLGRCLVDSTTKEDRIVLVQWMFAAAASHPAVQSLSKATPAQLEGANKALADLFTRLLTQSCVEKAKKAMSFEGPLAIQTGFQVLGQVAGTELFASPEVTKSMAGLEKFLDQKKLEKLGTAE